MSLASKVSASRGNSLVEVLVATAVLGIGSIATLRLVGLLISSNSNMSANTDAVAFASRLAAEPAPTAT
mgnify:CR=1 FL=1